MKTEKLYEMLSDLADLDSSKLGWAEEIMEKPFVWLQVSERLRMNAARKE